MAEVSVCHKPCGGVWRWLSAANRTAPLRRPIHQLHEALAGDISAYQNEGRSIPENFYSRLIHFHVGGTRRRKRESI